MIAECLIFLYTLMPVDHITHDFLNNYRTCNKIITQDVLEHADVLIEFFGDDKEQLSTAVKVIWCESRGNHKAVRTAEGNYDSGLFQFVSWTWNWVADKYDLPVWNEWVILKHDRPYTENKVSKTNYGFKQVRVQFSEYYNIYFGYLLSQEIKNGNWKDWSSSKGCWSNTDVWIDLVKQES